MGGRRRWFVIGAAVVIVAAAVVPATGFPSAPQGAGAREGKSGPLVIFAVG
jgi:hypothetical protein